MESIGSDPRFDAVIRAMHEIVGELKVERFIPPSVVTDVVTIYRNFQYFTTDVAVRVNKLRRQRFLPASFDFVSAKSKVVCLQVVLHTDDRDSTMLAP